MPNTCEPELQERIEQLAGAIQAERDALRRSSITVTVVGSTLLVIVTIFALINYGRLRTEWTEDKLAAGFQKELEVLNPTATDELRQLGQHLLPIYAETGRQQFMDMTPEIAARLREEAGKLGRNLESDAQARLAGASDRIRQQAEEITFAAYPGLRSAGEQDRLSQTFRDTTDTAVGNAVTGFGELFATDVRKLEQRIHAFNVERSAEPTIELQKRFIHLWLRLLDAEIMKK